MQATPPETMANSVDTAAATTPDSKPPSRGPPSTTAICTEAIRDRKAAGTDLCRIVVRRTAEITSAQPARARRARAAHSALANPKATMAAPHTQTATTTASTWRRT